MARSKRSDLIDLSQDAMEDELPVPPRHSAATRPPSIFTPQPASYRPPAAAVPSLSSVCPVCSKTLSVTSDAEFDLHVRRCLGLEDEVNPAASSSAAAAASSSHCSVVVPIATVHGVMNVSAQGTQSQPMIIDDSDDETESSRPAASSSAAASSTRHVLTSRASQPPSTSVSPAPQPPSPTSSMAAASSISMSFHSPSISYPSLPSTAASSSSSTPAAAYPYSGGRLIPAATFAHASPAAASSSSPAASSSVHPPPSFDSSMSDVDPPLSPRTLRQIAAMSASGADSGPSLSPRTLRQIAQMSGGGENGEIADADMDSDEALVRRMQAEEVALAESARKARQEREEREWRELVQKEGSCAKCGRLATSHEDLIQVCENAAKRAAAGEPTCQHKICRTCIREYLQHVVRRMKNPQLNSPTATTFAGAAAAAASSSSSSSAFSKPISQLTESDLMCPYPGCSTSLSQWQIRACLPTKEEFEQLLELTVRNTMRTKGTDEPGGAEGRPRYVSCPNVKCGNTFEGVPGSGATSSQAISGTVEMGLDGQPMSLASKQHRAANRFRCNVCSTVFCGGCSATPYHDGFACAAWKSYGEGRKCRFCDVGLTEENTCKPGVHDAAPSGGGHTALAQRAVAMVGGVFSGMAGLFGGGGHAAAAASSSSSSSASSAASFSLALADVCTSSECLAKRQLSCTRTLPCGHLCRGIRDERDCLPCLEEDCADHKRSGCDQVRSDYCNIDYVEELGQAPTVQLACSHMFHLSCLLSKLNKKWPGARITFGFMACPLCKVELKHPALTSLMAPLLKLRSDIQSKAVARLQFEGLEHDPAFESPQGRYYGRKEEYAMDRFAYYLCSKCSQPYFGGQRRCEEAAQAGEEKFDPAQLVCGGCTAGADVKNCAKHGKEFIEFKCKFCCNVATWYCWGSTHFCQSCHSRQEGGDYVTRKPISDLPKCPGPGKCPLGSQHPPNGTEFTLGCAVCRPRDY